VHVWIAPLEVGEPEIALLEQDLSAGERDRPELLDRVAYRLGAALGPLAGALAGNDEAELRALLDLPEGERVEEATRIARERGEAVSELPREALEREIGIAAAHSKVLAEHEAGVVEAPLRLIWAEQTLAAGVPPTDWDRHTRGGVEQTVLPGAHHHSVLTPPHVTALVAQLSRWVAASSP